PVQWEEGLRSWLAADYGSVVALSRSRLFVRATESPDARDGANRTLQRVEGAEHARLRSAVAGVFRRDSLRRLAGCITQLADVLVAVCCAGGPADLIAELAHPVSIRSIACVIGLPAEDLDALTTWTAAMAAAMGPAPSPSTRSSADAAT